MSEFRPIISEELTTGADYGLEEKQTVKMVADLRRYEAFLKKQIVEIIGANSPEDESIESGGMELIKRETMGEDIDPGAVEERLTMEGESIREKAGAMLTVAPNLSALLYARLAKLEQVSGKDFSDSYNKARQAIEQSRNLPKISPVSLLPELIMIDIAKRDLQEKQKPSVRQLAQLAIKEPDTIADIALTFDEKQREEFVSLLPPENRRKISSLMDNEVSRLLHKDIISDTGLSMRSALQKRVKQELDKAVLKQDIDFDKPLIKILSQTLGQLSDNESARILKEIGQSGLKSSKDKDANRVRISYVARILRELSRIDEEKGGNLTMKFMSKGDLPIKLFRYFTSLLMENEFITRNTSYYLEDDRQIPFLRRLLARNLNQFNTVIDTLSQISDYSPIDHGDEVFNAIDDLGDLTPIIFERYRLTDSIGKKELAHKINELKPKFFRNLPIKNILAKEDRDILVEMVHLAYKPVGMSFKKVASLIEQIDDHTGDLKEYIFPEDGYEFNLSSQKTYGLREGELLDRELFDLTHELIYNSKFEQSDSEVNQLSKVLANIAKAGTTYKTQELAKVLGLISDDGIIGQFCERYHTISESNQFSYLNELKEILGIYLKDNLPTRLTDIFKNQPEIAERIFTILADGKRQQELKKKIGKDAENFDWENINESEMGDILSFYFIEKIISPIVKRINREIKKFEENQGGELVEQKQVGLKAYISKNIGSFFAKASAGICTAEDIPLFKRKDHFHINIVENDKEVQANIQAYVIDDPGQKILVLRGFNPNVNFLERIDVSAFCEKVIDIAKQFVQDNNFIGVYITEQGGWHALSNREQVATYLSRKYHKQASLRHTNLQVSSSHVVSSIYEVYHRPENQVVSRFNYKNMFHSRR